MAERDYDNLDILIESTSTGYQVHMRGPEGEVSSSLKWQMTEDQFDAFLLRVGRPRRRTRRATDPKLDEAKRFGGQLYEAVFHGDALVNFHSCLTNTDARNVGLRIRLRLVGVPELTSPHLVIRAKC